MAISVFSNLTTPSISGVNDVWSQLQDMRVSTGLGALLWGIASDFYPGRRLLLIAAILLLPASGALWALDGFHAPVVGILGLGLVLGSLVCLPWVLMAELLPTRHFSKIALGVMFVGSLFGGTIGPILRGALTDVWGANAAWWIIPVLGIALAVVASRLPRPPERAPVTPSRKCVL